MFKYLFALFAVMAVAFSAPAPDAKPEPKPLVVSYGAAPLAYSAGVPYAYPAGAVYAAVPSAYSYY